MTIKLSEIVGQFLNSKDSSTHEFRRLMNIATFGMRTEFNLDITGTYRTQILDVNANKTVNFPCDYIKYSKIGVINERGEIATFTSNDQLATYNTEYTEDAGSRTVTNPILRGANIFPYIGNQPFWNYYNFWDNGDQFNLYGLPSGTANIGEFTIDERNKLIVLEPHFFYDKVVLEYLSNGQTETEGVDGLDYNVDVRVTQCMMSYIRWQNAIDLTKKYGAGQTQEWKREFYNQKRMAAMRTNPFNVSDLNKGIRASTNLTAKS